MFVNTAWDNTYFSGTDGNSTVSYKSCDVERALKSTDTSLSPFPPHTLKPSASFTVSPGEPWPSCAHIAPSESRSSDADVAHRLTKGYDMAWSKVTLSGGVVVVGVCVVDAVPTPGLASLVLPFGERVQECRSPHGKQQAGSIGELGRRAGRKT